MLGPHSITKHPPRHSPRSTVIMYITIHYNTLLRVIMRIAYTACYYSFYKTTNLGFYFKLCCQIFQHHNFRVLITTHKYKTLQLKQTSETKNAMMQLFIQNVCQQQLPLSNYFAALCQNKPYTNGLIS